MKSKSNSEYGSSQSGVWLLGKGRKTTGGVTQKLPIFIFQRVVNNMGADRGAEKVGIPRRWRPPQSGAWLLEKGRKTIEGVTRKLAMFSKEVVKNMGAARGRKNVGIP